MISRSTGSCNRARDRHFTSRQRTESRDIHQRGIWSPFHQYEAKLDGGQLHMGEIRHPRAADNFFRDESQRRYSTRPFRTSFP